MKARKPAKKSPREITKEARVKAILQIRLDGAESWDVVSFVSDQENADVAPWKMGRARKHLCERQIRRYIHDADALIVENCRTIDPDAFYRHLGKVRNLYARAVNSGDLSNARGLLRDAAELMDLYPAKKHEAKHAGKIEITLVEDDNFYGNKDRLASPAPDGSPTPDSQ
jgi:hypothetical protein